MTTRTVALRPLAFLTALSLVTACGTESESPADDAVVPMTSDSATGSGTGSSGAPALGSSASTTGSGTTAGPSQSSSAVPPVSSSASGSPSGSGDAPMAGGAPGMDTTAGTAGAAGALGMGGADNPGGPAGAGGEGGAGGGDTGTVDPGTGEGGSNSVGGAGGSGGTPAAGGAGTDTPSPLPPTDDYADFGPFETTSESGTGPDGSYTIVYPEALGEDGFLHAPITFGPGTGMQVSQMMGLLERIASHGFVIIGRQLDGGPGDAATRMRLTAGLDWIIEQNTTPGSVFEGKLDVDNAAAMGYSVGGTGSVEIGGHEAITTVVSIHGHGAEGDLHGPLLLLGGTEDVMGGGESWLAPTYEASQVQTFFGTVIGADHGYIQGTHDGIPGGVETPAMIAWLRYWIYNDQAAARYFEGDDCVMCDAPWTNPQRKNWP